jgi:hypothetical protein
MIYTVTEIVIQLYTIIGVHYFDHLYKIVKYGTHFIFYDASHHRKKTLYKMCGFLAEI